MLNSIVVINAKGVNYEFVGKNNNDVIRIRFSVKSFGDKVTAYCRKNDEWKYVVSLKEEESLAFKSNQNNATKDILHKAIDADVEKILKITNHILSL